MNYGDLQDFKEKFQRKNPIQQIQTRLPTYNHHPINHAHVTLIQKTNLFPSFFGSVSKLT